MRRITLTVVAILLAVPAAAFGKVGVEFAKDPVTASTYEAIPFNIMILREPRDPSVDGMTPITGARPVVTFKSATGEIVRVTGSRSDRQGMSDAVATFPDKGPWTGSLTVPRERLAESGGDLGTFRIGFDGTPAPAKAGAPKQPPAATTPASASSGSAIVWILLGAGALLIAGTTAAVRAGVPARLRSLRGGGA
jgi:hypothetical protein